MPTITFKDNTTVDVKNDIHTLFRQMNSNDMYVIVMVKSMKLEREGLVEIYREAIYNKSDIKSIES